VPLEVVELRDAGRRFRRSALTGVTPVPDGYYTEPSMRRTLVPMRNPILLCHAFGVAAERDLNVVAIAVHGDDHFIYPDCRPRFIKSFQSMSGLALDGVAKIELETPFLTWRKADIVRLGTLVGVSFTETWSCYKELDLHCGRCGACMARREAFDIGGIEDPTPYADPNYWWDARPL
jgi:7-cyano-7-deazaguanine synthase